MNEFIALLMFMLLAFSMAIAGLIAYAGRALYERYVAKRQNRMPNRIRSLNS